MSENEFPIAFVVVFLLFYLAILGLVVAAMWRIFTKAGQPGWASLIPIYNGIVLLRIVGKPTWWLLLFIIPFVNIVFLVWTYNMLSKSFGKDEGFTAGLVLVGVVFLPLLAFGDARYLGPYGNPAAFNAYGDRNKFDFDR